MCIFSELNVKPRPFDVDIIMVLFSQLKLICFTCNQLLVLFKM